MIITISGKPGAGKTTTTNLLAKKLGYKSASMGDLRGRIAIKHGMTIDELNEMGQKEIWTDKAADDELIRIGKEDNYVIDTWLGFHFVPKSIKIFLDVDEKVGAKRVFNDQRPDEKEKKTVKEIEKMLRKRFDDTWARYKKYYNLELDKGDYDLILNTTNLTKVDVVEKVLKFIKD